MYFSFFLTSNSVTYDRADSAFSIDILEDGSFRGSVTIHTQVNEDAKILNEAFTKVINNMKQREEERNKTNVR